MIPVREYNETHYILEQEQCAVFRMKFLKMQEDWLVGNALDCAVEDRLKFM